MDKPHRGVFVSALQPHRNIVTTPPPILVPLAFIPVPVRLLKYQALGNDYLVLDLPGPLDELVRLLPILCHRQFGLGSDGLLAFEPTTMSVRIFNPDGSEAQKSGNGLRITAAHAVLEHGASDRFEIRTVDRSNAVRVLEVSGPRVSTELDIGMPSFNPADLPALVAGEPRRIRIETPAGTVEAVLVSVGNPHAVVFGERVDAARAVELGPHIERHPIFPERTNVQLVEVLDRSHARIEIWERGAGYTLASGTSASAVAAALMRDGLVDDEVTIVMPGGDLRIRKGSDGNLIQQGPAQRVYRAEIELADLERATTAT
jgi:diaminopimelate epimerase